MTASRPDDVSAPLRAGLLGVTSFLPATALSNAQLAAELGGDWTPEQILAKTGIANRYIASEGECASDLGVQAAQRLFASGICGPGDIDFFLFCTQSPDHFLPATACGMHQRLGLRADCGAVDFNQGCSGFVYGLSLAKGLVESGAAARVLLVTAETYSKFLNPRDRSARTIFGDGAAAVLVGPVLAPRELIGPFVFGTDGSGAKELIVPAGGLRCRPGTASAVEFVDDSGNWRSADNLYMNGPEVFSFTLRVVPALVERLLVRTGISLADVDYFVFHQASKFMLDHLRARTKIPEERFCRYLEHCGNTVSSTIPIALESARRERAVGPGARVMLVGFGVGLSWAATMIEIPEASFWTA